jgi:antitoxin MazE
VDALGLREGDDIEIEVAGSRNFKIGRDHSAGTTAPGPQRRDHSKDDAIERLKPLNWSLPPGFRFSRDEANER